MPPPDPSDPVNPIKRLDDRRTRRIQPAIAIGHKKFWSQTVERAANCTTHAEQSWPVDDLVDLDAEPAAVTNKALYLLPAMTD
jgi:hypothetical protein